MTSERLEWGYLAVNPDSKQRAKGGGLPEARAEAIDDTQFWRAEEWAAVTRYVEHPTETDLDEVGSRRSPNSDIGH